MKKSLERIEKKINSLIPHVDDNFFEIKKDKKGLKYTFLFHFIATNHEEEKILANIPNKFAGYISIDKIDGRNDTNIFSYSSRGYMLFWEKSQDNIIIENILNKILEFVQYLEIKTNKNTIIEDNNFQESDDLFNKLIYQKYYNFNFDTFGINIETEYDFSKRMFLTIKEEDLITKNKDKFSKYFESDRKIQNKMIGDINILDNELDEENNNIFIFITLSQLDVTQNYRNVDSLNVINSNLEKFLLKFITN